MVRGRQKRTVEVVSGTALWHSTGLPAVPLRWALIRNPQGGSDTQALCYAPTSMPNRSRSSPGSSGVGRWKALSRKYANALASKPSDIGRRGRLGGLPRRCWGSSRWLRSSLTLRRRGCPTLCDGRHGTTSLIQPSPMLWRWCEKSCGRRRRLFAGRLGRPRRYKSPTGVRGKAITDAVCYTA